MGTAPPAGAIPLTLPGTTTPVDVSGSVDGLAVVDTGGGPRQRPQALTELRFQAHPTRPLHLQLTLRGRAGGPFEGGQPGVMNFAYEFQNRTPSLEWNEAWAELRQGDFQLRAGIQKFAWGKLDGGPPTDVLTPRDLHDPLVRDFEESKIGIPAIQGTYYLPPVDALGLSELRATLVYVPFAVPSRVALVDERWFPPSVDPTSEFRFTASEAERVFGAAVPVRIPVTLHTRNDRPARAFTDGGVALRLGGSWLGADWDLYHYTGPETGPDAELDVTVMGKLVTPTLVRAPADLHLRQTSDTIHMTGFAGSAVLRGVTVRMESAFFVNRPYLRDSRDLFTPAALAAIPKKQRDHILDQVLAGRRAQVPVGELFPDRDSVEWGIGADYLINGFVPLVQVNQVIFTDAGPSQLLANPDTRLLASLRRRFLQDALELEIRGLYEFERDAWFVMPRVSYRLGDHWRFRFGYLAIGGPSDSLLGQYHANDEFLLESKYFF